LEEVYVVKIVGTKPLLMHAPVGLGDKPTRRRGEHLDPKDEAEMCLYKDPQGRIVMPSVNVKACIRDAGRNYRIKGRKSTFAAMIKAAIDIGGGDYLAMPYRAAPCRAIPGPALPHLAVPHPT
jgi:hypothetical protein